MEVSFHIGVVFHRICMVQAISRDIQKTLTFHHYDGCETLAEMQTEGPLTVDLEYAQYQGVFNETTSVTSFLGIRYAAAPVGDLRWRAPAIPPNVTGIQQADSWPPQCYQAGLPGAEPSDTSEDCLFLNVYHPGDSAPAENLPVIVWIHGGGYVLGSALGFHGADLISQSNGGVVVVTIQYRLGVFGFLAGNEIHADGALNAGLLDQNFALRWVNKHISKFGGDPERVAIWGESAGAGSVLQHVIAEDGQTTPQLFRGAIASSTFLPSQFAYNDTIPQTLYDQVVDAVGCKSSQNTLSCLREADTNALQSANRNINTGVLSGMFVTVPVVDGTFIRQRATQALREGKVNGNALLTVHNTNEGDLFVNQTATNPLNASQYAASLFPKLTQQDTAAVAELYAGLGSDVAQESLIMGEAIFICPTYFFADAFRNHTYKAEFAIPPAIHGQDSSFYWPSLITLNPGTLLGSPITFNNTDFIDAFAQSFVSFAISLDPNVKVDPSNITPQWDLYSLLH
ncbi:hypothetical protein AAF712_007225 [Marasmius tenuissimus]|uniref:Carboxylic ester hydrolase n=1 Tax=Marasmius tenuissimus TaxID=585030 RepID=A0ABR2ZZL1_9AGAR